MPIRPCLSRLAPALAALALSACNLASTGRPAADATPPSVPTGLTAAAASPSRVTLSWAPSTDAGTGVGGYQVLRGGSLVATVSAPTTAHEDASVLAGTAYQYAVRAFDRAQPPNLSAASASVEVTTPTPGTAPGLDARPANLTCLAPPRPTTGGGVRVARAFPNLSFSSPVALLQVPGDAGRRFVVEQGGTVRAFADDPAAAASTTFLDIRARVTSGGELGLLGMAFHPAWPATREAFLSYTAPAGGGKPLRSVVSRFTGLAGAPPSSTPPPSRSCWRWPSPSATTTAA